MSLTENPRVGGSIPPLGTDFEIQFDVSERLAALESDNDFRWSGFELLPPLPANVAF